MIHFILISLLLSSTSITSAAQQADVHTLELGLENNDDRCLLNALFHTLSFGLSAYKKELDVLSKNHTHSVVAAYVQDLTNYQACTRFTYSLKDLYSWWITKDRCQLSHQLYSSFVEDWNQVVQGETPSIAYVCLMPVDSYAYDASTNSWHIIDNSSLIADIQGNQLGKTLPDILMFDAQFQEGVVRSLVESTYIKDKREQVKPYEIPVTIDLAQHVTQELVSEPQLYQLIGVICRQQSIEGGIVHATSCAKTAHEDWIYMDNVTTEKVSLSQVLACQLPRSITTMDKAVYEIGQVFVYQRM